MDFGPEIQARIDEVIHEATLEIAHRVERIDEALQGRFFDDFDTEFGDEKGYGRLNRENLLRLRLEMLREADEAMNELWSENSPPILRAMQRIADIMNELEDEDGEPKYDVDPDYISRIMRRAFTAANGRQEVPQGESRTRQERRFYEERSATGVATQLRRLINKPKRKIGESKAQYENRIARGKRVLYSPEGGEIRSRIHKNMLTQPQIGEEEATIYLVRQRIIELEKDIKAHYGKDPKNARGTAEYEELKTLRREFEKRSKVWVRQVLNLSGIKSLAFSESVKQLQYAQMNMVRGFGFYLARWTLSPLHPRTDVCDVCAGEVWIDPGEREEIVRQAIIEENLNQGVEVTDPGFEEWLRAEVPDVVRGVRDWGGVVVLPSNATFIKDKSLIIPKLAEMSKEEVASLILKYPLVGKKSADTRKKLGGYFPPHPLCKCRLIPMELDILLYDGG